MCKEPQRQLRPIRILIVEDDLLQQDLLNSALVSQGYEVEVASDGMGAFWKVRENKYDLVLIDYQLPEIDGLAMARLIHGLMGEVARPALIALTGSPDCLADKEVVPGIAFDHIVSKSVGLGELVSTIRRHLDARPDAAAREEAGSALFLDDWINYDTDPGSDNGQGGQPAPPCVLVVEDDELQQSVLKSAFEGLGFAVEVASDGLQAVRMIREGAFDLAVVDYQLPEMDGLATGRLIVDLLSEDTRPRMIGFTSATSHLAGRLASTGGAFDEIVPKSAGMHTLFATVERHLRLSPRSSTRRAAANVFPSAVSVVQGSGVRAY